MKKILLVASLTIFLTSCDNTKNAIVNQFTDGKLTLDFKNLGDLGSDAKYEGWVMVAGRPKSTGKFTVDATGKMSDTEFAVDKTDLLNADEFVLTIEPEPDPSTDPSSVHILAGSFVATTTTASLTTSYVKAIGVDLTTATGGYILRTPTDGNDNMDEESGVWFLNPKDSSASLKLPVLSGGWKYEGWAVIDGNPISTGTFSNPSEKDDDGNPFGAGADGPPFPGEDFLKNSPNTNVTFPTDLRGKTIVISVEPDPDNSTAPFFIKPLTQVVPAAAATKTLLTMTPNIDKLPTGTATKK